jgi:hypothetical protein
MITVSADTGDAVLPVAVFICETNPTTGLCTTPLAPSVTRLMNPNETPTFAVFARGSGNVPFDPAKNRIFVRLKENVSCEGTSGAVTRGSTSVAVQTQ